MANPAPTINQINAFNATQGTTIDFNIIGGTELVRSNRIYIYDLSDNSLICTHLYVSTESIHELPPNTDGSIVYESGKSSADFVNGAQYYAQIQTFTDIAGTEGGSGLSVAKMFWCLVDPTLTITTIPSTISTTSYNVSATYDANTSVVSNIIQQYQFSLYSATGSLLQSSGVVVGSGTQQGTSTAYDISYNFTGLSVGSSYYVVVDVTTTQGMSVSAQSSTFTVSIDTPTLGEATVVNNACDGYISVTSNLSGEYGGSGSGEIVSFETDSENVFTKLQVDLEPVQEGTPWVSASDTEPYLMRISPQFDHDYNTEFDTLVGGTVAWNQKIPVNLNTGGTINCTKSYDSGTGIMTITPTNYANSAGPYLGNVAPAGHVCLSIADIKPDHAIGMAFGVETTDNLYFRIDETDKYTRIYQIGKPSALRAMVCYYAPWIFPDTRWEDGSFLVKNVQCFDLTQMFGSTVADAIYAMEQAHTGDGVAFFRKYFSKAYYAYDAGTLMSVKTSAHKTTGKNLLEMSVTPYSAQGVTISQNGKYVHVVANSATGYPFTKIGAIPSSFPSGVYWLPYSTTTAGIDFRIIDRTVTPAQQIPREPSGRVTIPSGHNGYTVEIAITGASLANGTYDVACALVAENITFEPYVEHTYPLDSNLELRGLFKLENSKLKADGDVYSSSGSVQRKYGIVTLNGSESWNIATGDVNAYFYTVLTGDYLNSNYKQAIVSDRFTVGNPTSTVATYGDNSIWFIYRQVHIKADLTIAPSGLTTEGITELKAWLSNNPVTVVVPLATPTTETAMPFESNQSIVPNGSEEYVDNRTVPIPVGHLTSYADVYPITGHDSVDVEHTGVNIWDEKWEIGSIDTNTGKNTTSITDRIRSKNYITVLPNTTYYFKRNNIAGNIFEYDSDKNFLRVVSSPTTFTTSSLTYYVRFYMGNAYGTTYHNDLGVNYPSTDHDYHTYTGQSYHQDIEVTYTPTVQDNTPYLLKQTGDVGGDRETIELAGGTVAWNQLVQNGNFADTSIWYRQTGVTSISASSNILTATINGGSTDAGWKYSIFQAITNIPSGASEHKFVFSISINTSIDSTFRCELGGGVKINTSNITANHWVDLTTVCTKAGNNNQFMVYPYSAVNNVVAPQMTVQYKNAQLIDLTQMFGSTIADYIYSLEQANAGAGVAFFRSLFPKAYYPYNAGELISVKTSSHDTVGKNQLDYTGYRPSAGGLTNTLQNGKLVISGVPTSNYVQVVPAQDITNRLKDGATYTLSQTKHQTYVYPQVMGIKPDGTRSYYLATTQNATFTVDKSVYEKYEIVVQANTMSAWGSSSRTIETGVQLEFGSQATEYEPYTKNTYPLDADLELRGMLKLDANNNLYYDGDTYASDGAVTRKYGIVDLGTLNWVYSSSYDLFYAYNQIPQKPNGQGTIPNAVQAKYTLKTFTDLNNDRTIDKALTLYGNTSNVYVDIRDSSANGNATTLKSSLNGVYLVYELATPTTETADAFEEIQICSPYGTEEFVDNRAVPIPVGNNTQYFTRDIYGGYIDLVSGVLVVTWAIANLGDLSWTYADGIFYGSTLSNAPIATPYGTGHTGLCSQYVYLEGSSTTYASADKVFSYSNQNFSGLAGRVIIKDTLYNDATTFKTAMNGVQLAYELATPQTYQLTPQQIQTLVGVNNVWSEQGDIELSYHIPITNLLVKRQDVADVSGDWLTLYSQPITQASDMDFTFIDFTNQYGKTYKYALVPLLTQTQSGVEVEVEGGYTVSDEVQSIFDGVFIVDSTGSQKCKANVGYGNVDMNQAVGTITPIGAKYPVVITNSKNQYHNGSIYGTIVPDDYYFNGNLSRIDMVNKRDELEQFLTNKRAKIIKDWNGKIWLVMIMDNVSCTFNNNYGMGIVNFNTNWVEVGDPTNQQDLQATGLINVGGV